ncbi:RNA polymerase I-specific transcription initiation factor RRN3-like isoform X1 [Branchiostoma lanceolatum]|uniref:RNA polymerase I-specific transcription initiation factor RRN3-like isoform X1 n=1 Tax=Branchiostoma lanceolatum TaxID=7740 RepID=UPI003455D6A2
MGDSMRGKEAIGVKSVRFGGEIVEVLKNYKRGQETEYHLLVHQLSDPDIKPQTLICWLKELKGCVAFLTKEFETLVGVILKISWANSEDEVVKEFLSFLGNLVSAQTFYLRACLKMLVKTLVPRVSNEVPLDEIKIEEYNRTFENAHSALQRVLHIVPLAPKFLAPVLADCFPYMKKDAFVQECYVRNLLQMTSYVPSLRLPILELIIDRMIRIDVHAPKHELEEDEEEEDAEVETMEHQDDTSILFEMDGMECGSGTTTDQQKAAPELAVTMETEKDKRMTHEMGDRLDVMMTVMLQFIKDSCVNKDTGELQAQPTIEMFRHLLTAFEKLLLPTHASCHVQFLVFYIASLRQDLADAFLNFCWRKVQSPNTPVILRQAAAAYMASFLARANFVPLSTVIACLDLLLPWIHRYIDDQDGSTRSYPDVNLHGTFYSVCQGVFYMFVFRHKQFVESKKGLNYIRGLNFDRVINCRLNPLKVCLPTIVNMFASITRMYQIVMCYTIMEKNNRSVLPVVASSQGGPTDVTNLNPLDAFFPFDPYMLSRSKRFIQPLYQEWEGNNPDQDEANSEEDEDDFLQGAMSPGTPHMGTTPGSIPELPGFRKRRRTDSSCLSPPLT